MSFPWMKPFRTFTRWTSRSQSSRTLRRFRQGLTLERLEDRTVLSNTGVISGTKWLDSNYNGVHDGSEAGLAGVTVYLDTNNNGVKDTGEPSTVTAVDNPATTGVDEKGTYTFSNLAAGTYHVREVIPTGYLQTSLGTLGNNGDGSWTIALADGQTHTNVDFVNAPGVISGTKWSDNNNNGIRDTNLIVGTKPDVVFVIDVSGSTSDPFLGSSVGDVNSDGTADTILDAELAGFIALNQRLVTQGLGNKARVSIVVFGDTAANEDLNPVVSGTQLAVAPLADADHNGTADVEQVLKSITAGHLGVGTNTNFEAGLQTTISTFTSLATAAGQGNVVFLSDGMPTTGGTYTDEVSTLQGMNTNLRAFGAGDVASLSALQTIDSNASIFHTTDEILAAFGVPQGTNTNVTYTEPGLAGVTIYLDTNNNGIKDSGEPTALTDPTGAYTFSNLSAGTYTVREVAPAGYVQTSLGTLGNNSDGSWTVTLSNGTTTAHAINKDFGNAPGSISGTKWSDDNNNGIRDTDLIVGTKPDLVFVIDVSGSTSDSFLGSSVGDVNGDGKSDTILDAELAGFIALNQRLIGQGLGSQARVAIVVFADTAANEDLNPVSSGKQIAVTPSADADHNGISDVEQVLKTITAGHLSVGSGTNFEVGLQKTISTFTSIGTVSGQGNVIFLSDGFPNGGGTYTDEVSTLHTMGVNVRAFGAGDGAGLAALQTIDPKASIFHTTDDILGAFGNAQGASTSVSYTEPGLANVTIYLDINNNGIKDSGEPTAVTDSNGAYTFNNLSAGTYKVREVVPAGYVQTSLGTLGNNSDGSWTVTLGGSPANAVATGKDFGNTPGVISGTKWFDINSNGIRDNDLIVGSNPDVMFVLDVSLSTHDPFLGTPVGDVNGDGKSNTILDAELAGYIALNQRLIDQGLGNLARISIVVFANSAVSKDLNPVLSGKQLAITPLADADNNGVPDVKQILKAITVNDSGLSKGTNFEAGLQKAISVFNSIATAPGQGNMIFLSDGYSNQGGPYDDEAAILRSMGVNLRAFGAGDGAKLSSLRQIDPKAVIFHTSDELLALFGTPQGGGSGLSYTEPGLSGVSIYLDQNNNGVKDAGEPTVVTDANGNYSFTNLSAGTYTVREVVPSGYVQSSLGTLGNNLDGSWTVVLGGAPARGQALGRDFGNALPTVAGQVYVDNNGNGIKDVGEVGQPGVTVYLDANNNGMLDSTPLSFASPNVPKTIADLSTVSSTLTVSGMTGKLLDLNVHLDITHQSASDLLVVLIAPNGQQILLINNRGNGRNFKSTVLDDQALNLISAGDSPFNGSFQPEQPLSDFNGLDPNGTWTLKIFDTVSGTGGTLNSWSLDVTSGEVSATTDDSGNYLITNLTPGATYVVREVVPSGYTLTAPPGGSYTVVATAPVLGKDFGNAPLEIRGQVYIDSNATGIKDVSDPPQPGVTVYLDANNNGMFDTATQTFSATDVPKTIPDLGAPTSTINVSGTVGQILDVNVKLDISHTYDSDLIVTLIAPNGRQIALISAEGGGNDNFTATVLDDQADTAISDGTLSFTGSFRPEGKLSSFNGIDPTGNWTLRIQDRAANNSGTLNSWSLTITTGEANTTSDELGNYTLGGLTLGSTYVVREVLPTGYALTEPAGGSYSVTMNNLVTGKDFGNAPLLSGQVYVDANGNGSKDVGEIGQAGVNVYIDANNNGMLDGTPSSPISSTDISKSIPDEDSVISTLTVSGLSGRLQDLNIALNISHTYDSDLVVTLIAPTGQEILLIANRGGSGVNFATTTLDDQAATFIGNASAPFNGSFRPENPLYVLNGIDPNGIWKLRVEDTASGDTGTLNSWSVTITSGETSTTTDANGNYRFTSLTAGSTYVVREVVPASFALTAPVGGSYTVTLTGPIINKDFGNAPVEIRGQVYEDANGNASHDAGEVNQSGLTVYLDANNNGALDTAIQTISSTNIPKTINDLTTVTSTLVVGNPVALSGVLLDVNVNLDISHTYDGDLIVTLVAPNGQQIVLLNGEGSGANFTGTVLDDQATTPIYDNDSPFTGSFRPEFPLSALNGINPNGTWKLRVQDSASGDTGTLNNWSLTITSGEVRTTSDALGNYLFGGLTLGNIYDVREVIPAGYVLTNPALGSYNVTANGPVSGKDFANGPLAISGETYFDSNNNSALTAGEPGLPGVTVYLDANNNGSLDTGTQTFVSSDVPKTIADLGTATSNLGVAGLNPIVLDVNVNLNISHTYDGDLTVTLVAPNGQKILLISHKGGGGENFITTLDDQAATALASGHAPFTGSFRPDHLLSALNGINPNGTWSLIVQDTASGDSGVLNSWSLTITSGEVRTSSDGLGHYTFNNLTLGGTYVVREVVPAGYTATGPVGGYYPNVTVNGPVLAKDFGNTAFLNAAVSGNILYIFGNDSAQTITLRLKSGDSTKFEVLSSGVLFATFDVASYSSIIVLLQGGNDSLRIDNSNGNPIPSGGLSFDGGSGSDTLFAQNSSNTWVLTGPTAGTLSGGVIFTTVEVLGGGTGNDSYVFDTDVALGAFTISDAGGTDTLDFSSSSLGVTVNLGVTTAQVVDSNLTLTLSANLENLLGGSGNDSLTGNSLSNMLNGQAGNDTYSFDTDNFLGSDTINESTGTDTLNFSATTTKNVAINLGVTTAQAVNSNLTLTLGSASTMEYVLGGTLDDKLTGNSLNNILNGQAGNDTYFFDTDTALGNDTISESGVGIDAVNFSGTTTKGVAVNLGIATAQVVNSNLTLTLGSASTIENVVGGTLNDIITGNSLNNTLTGLGGNDTYVFDTDSALGNDTISESGGTDTLDYSGTTTLAVAVNLGVGTAQVVNSNLTLTLGSASVIENVLGGALNDSLTGNSLNNMLNGEAGNDTYSFDTDSFLGSDTINESTGTDTLTFSATTTLSVAVNLGITTAQVVNSNLTLTLGSGSSMEYVVGGTLDDKLTGNSLNNILNGQTGNDTYFFDADTALGSDTISESGVGIDSVNFANTTTLGVTVNLGVATAQVVNSNLTLTLGSASTIENVVGGTLNDTLTGNSLNNSLTGLGGNDTYVFDTDSALGNDTISESGGIDTLDFSATTTQAVAVNLGVATAQVVNSNLTLTLGSVSTMENVVGGSLDDTLTGNTLNNTLTGLAGSDTLTGQTGNDTYVFDTDSALGNDTISESGGIDTLDFSATTTQTVAVNLGIATAQVVNSNLTLTLGSASTIENVVGGTLNDSLTGNSLNNLLNGQSGNDTYVFDTDSALGNDTISESGAGTDTLDFSATTTLGVTVNLGVATAQVVNSNLTLTLGSASTIENVVGGSLNDSLTGNSLGNMLNGQAGNDTYSFDTDNFLGSDTVNESTGTDTLNFSATTTKNVAVNLGITTAQAVNSNLTLTLGSAATMEYVLGGTLDDKLTGNSLNNILNGQAGNDTYFFDTDTALGNDTISESGVGIDAVNFSGTTTLGVTVNLGLATAQVVNGNLTLTLGSASTIENVVGGTLNDILTGNSLNNTLTGLAGNDTLNGQAGNDTYVFNTDSAQGNDTISESGGADTLDFSATTTKAVAVNLGVATAQVVNSNLTLTLGSASTIENVLGGSLADTLTGNSLNNVLSGGAGNDSLSGGDGRDILLGGAGADTLSGGNDEDILLGAVYSQANNVTALNALMAEWSRTDLVYSQRIAHLMSGGGNNDPYFLTTGTGGTISNDSAGDTETGNAALDWFFSHSGEDNVTDASGETITAIP